MIRDKGASLANVVRKADVVYLINKTQITFITQKT